MKTFKGFNKNMTCRGFQYEEGKSYETEKADVCREGFHACKYPLDCFDYYNPATSVFHEVEQSGKTSKSKDGVKMASTKIKIGVRLSIADLVKAVINFTKARIKLEASADGDYGTASATLPYDTSLTRGRYSVSSAKGYKSTSLATGYKSVSSNEGVGSASLAMGYKSASLAMGEFSVASVTGDYSVSSATSDYSVSSAIGPYSMSSVAGDRSASVAINNFSASSAAGNCGVAAVTGHASSAEVENPTALAVAWGHKSRAKGVKGSYLVLADWKEDEDSCDEVFSHWTLQGVKLIHVDGKKYKENIWYEYSDGVVKECMEEK